jgi:UDP-N-acetylglucosamine 4-epimerase
VTSSTWLQRNNNLRLQLETAQARWLVTGAAGFIGSHLVERLLRLNQVVVGLDNFATGHRANLADVEAAVGADAWSRFFLLEGDIRDPEICRRAMNGVDHVLHQAALGSVPRSIADPLTTNAVNIGGFLNVLDAARLAGVRSFVYAASSSTYGNEPNLPKLEDRIGSPLSPYAVTKLVNEQYAAVYRRTYDFRATGLRYFNVFGPRQDPNGAYAAVIPRWMAAVTAGEPILINGDGLTSRDFCFIDNVVQANLLASVADLDATGEVYNIAFGERTTLLELADLIRTGLRENDIAGEIPIVHCDFRAGDVRHSLADISKASRLLGYEPDYDIRNGMAVAAKWYAERLRSVRGSV